MTRVNDLETPTVVLDWPCCRGNISKMQSRADAAGIELRPHIKTHKMIPVAREQLRAGAAGICCAKTSEAEAMLPAGPTEIFVTFPIWGEAKLARLAKLADAVPTQTTVDGIEQARGMSAYFQQLGRTIDVLVEVDTGLHRTGVAPGEPALDMAKQVDALPGLNLLGLFCHEGELARDWPDADERAKHVAEPIEKMQATKALLDRAGLRCDALWPGCTPSAWQLLEVAGFTALRPGTYVFNDAACIRFGSATVDELAVTVHCTVVAKPAADRLVIDAGSKTLAADRNEVYAHGMILGHDELEIVKLNEEHGWVRVKPDRSTDLQVGDRVRVAPSHICPCINLHDSVAVVEGDEVIDRWTVDARGKVL